MRVSAARMHPGAAIPDAISGSSTGPGALIDEIRLCKQILLHAGFPCQGRRGLRISSLMERPPRKGPERKPRMTELQINARPGQKRPRETGFNKACRAG
ncbi:hypothetical protein GC209_18960 [bacterium]|nr:hypothetical protein [bacterium]